MMVRLASQAALCYNEVLNIVALGGAGNTPSRLHLIRRCNVNTLSPHAQEGNTSFATIPLVQGGFAIVDPEDADLAQWQWRTHNGYVVRYTAKTIHMHRLILERKLGRPIQPGMLADHKNRNRSDNRRENLREATHRQSVLNRSSFVRLSHGYTGLRVEKRAAMPDKWGAYLRAEGKTRYLGSYDTPKEASLARDRAMLEEYGEFVRLNNPIEEVLAWQSPSINPRPKQTKGYRGTRKQGQYWIARLHLRGKNISLGTFDTSDEAARAYDRAALKAYGDKATLNFPREDYQDG